MFQNNRRVTPEVHRVMKMGKGIAKKLMRHIQHAGDEEIIRMETETQAQTLMRVFPKEAEALRLAFTAMGESYMSEEDKNLRHVRALLNRS